LWCLLISSLQQGPRHGAARVVLGSYSGTMTMGTPTQAKRAGRWRSSLLMVQGD
jgi:hypothetical protein